jgi:hypothetical protein
VFERTPTVSLSSTPPSREEFEHGSIEYIISLIKEGKAFVLGFVIEKTISTK